MHYFFSISMVLVYFSQKVQGYVHMCWYVNWAEKRHLKPFSPDLIDYDLCSHILYSAALIDPNTLTVGFMQQNISENLEKILNSKSKYKKLKIILVIGTYDTKSYGFNSVTNPKNTKQIEIFSENIIKFLRKFNFDGVLLDYEFPNMLNRGSPPHTKQGFSILVKIMKEKFKQESLKTKNSELLLMAAMAGRVDWIDKFYENEKIFNHLDYLLLLTFDLKSSREKKTRITSALFPLTNEEGIQSTFNIASTVAKYITNGANPNKLVIGIPAYGRSFELENPNRTKAGSPALGPAMPGNITQEDGVLSYFEICDKIGKSGSKKFWNQNNLGPFLVYDKKYWVGYEDLDSIYEKMLFIKANNLSGAFLWSIDLDDYDGKHCSQGSYPLLRAIKAELTSQDQLKHIETQLNTASKKYHFSIYYLSVFLFINSF
ncbi:Acidic mammalian [Brachionus plicatilis]|uniref:Acidic mammalian n=1 Tax=Brachionus plicatilis TaxID=10195 RepID=A0A3M7RI84_BRAPC|nr:Acidic mammalian [Brachionus plicatilis]